MRKIKALNIFFKKFGASVFLTGFLLLGGVGCMTEEKITPAYEVKSLEDEINYGAPLVFDFTTDPIDVQDNYSTFGNIDRIGSVFRILTEMLTDREIELGRVGKFKLGPFEYTMPELDDVDFNYVRNVIFQRVELRIEDEVSDANFQFIKGIQVFVRFEDELGVNAVRTPRRGTNDDGPPDSMFEDAYLILTYQKDATLSRLGCGGRCINFNIHDIDWRSRLVRNRNFTVLVKLDVAKAPKTDLKLKGYFSIKVPLNLQGL